ncbi:hypothetical protein SAMN05444396_111109 [Flavobacterium segetis]|uniref:Uncharacterized protein n=1 Tax=Flavobacterium segetis TaxID=271157 RepID=A0A1M5JMV5_9FLAO|nr:hypothetical protein SAMN05444396_111109 [Flavobacterium segetis]
MFCFEYYQKHKRSCFSEFFPNRIGLKYKVVGYYLPNVLKLNFTQNI